MIKNMQILFPFRDANIKPLNSLNNDHPNEFMYGCHKLVHSENVIWFNSKRGVRNTILRKCLYPIEHTFSRFTKLGWPMEMVLENRKIIRQSNKIILLTCP